MKLKFVKRILHKALTLLRERRYKSVKHLFFPCKSSDKLVVIFSAFGAPNTPPRYNYLNALRTARVNKLYVLDQLGFQERVGVYNLGLNGDFFQIDEVCELVKKVMAQCGAKKLCCAGSSKGGTSAVFFGLKLGADLIVSGAPQYRVGSYLSSRKLSPILEKIMGDASEDSAAKLNAFFENAVREQKGSKSTVFLHYSPKEHTFAEHIQYLIEDLRAIGVNLIEDNDYDYVEHGDVAKYFPEIIRAQVDSFISSK